MLIANHRTFKSGTALRCGHRPTNQKLDRPLLTIPVETRIPETIRVVNQQVCQTNGKLLADGLARLLRGLAADVGGAGDEDGEEKGRCHVVSEAQKEELHGHCRLMSYFRNDVHFNFLTSPAV